MLNVLIQFIWFGNEEMIVEHYSIQAIDIFINEIESSNGWHRGDAVQYKVNNCAWESRVQLQLKTNELGRYELQGMQIFECGDQEKMIKDQEIMQMAFQAHIYHQQQENRVIKWEVADIENQSWVKLGQYKPEWYKFELYQLELNKTKAALNLSCIKHKLNKI